MTTSTQGAPTYASDGHIVWKPQVGYVFDPEKQVGHSYGGVVTALQEVIESTGIVPKAYPHNFAGIISAIQDLDASSEADPPVVIQPIPPGSIIDPITGDLNVIIQPADGLLWFDSRQGRLFVAADNEWWQTNGADGLAYVRDLSNPPVDNVLPGQFWYEPESNDLYVYADGDWVRIVDADGLQTTRTLPLSFNGPKEQVAAYQWEIVPEIEVENFTVQEDYNQWTFHAIAALETEVSTLDPVYLGDAPPADPRPGALWYDNETLELSIWYDDGDSAQWVPTAASYTYDKELDVVRSMVEQESRARDQAIHQLYIELDGVNAQALTDINSKLSSVEAALDNVPTYDLEPYAKTVNVSQSLAAISDDLSLVEHIVSNYNELATTAEVTTATQALEQSIALLASKEELAAVENAIPSLNAYATTTSVDQKIAAIADDYLPRTGGALSGSFTLNNSDADTPTFDFSQYITSGKNAFKFQTQAPTTGVYSTFGLTDKFYEYAWNFASDEDYCWIYNDTNKVFSITKEGPACSQLYIGDITMNSAHERMIVNKIDVRDRLTKYQYAFTTLRAKVHSASDFAELKQGILEALSQV